MAKVEFSDIGLKLKSAPIPADWVIEGVPTARNAVVSISQDRLATTLLWECTEGAFRWIYDVDETIHILEGSVSLKADDGSTRLIGPGDIVFFPAGSTAIWRVNEKVRKLAFFRYPSPKPLALAVKAAHKLDEKIRAFRLADLPSAASLAGGLADLPSAPSLVK